MRIEHGVAIAPRTTIGLGGPAEHFLNASTLTELREGLAIAAKEDWAVTLLGGGSNVVVSDAGISGLVVRWRPRGTSWTSVPGGIELCAAGGEEWDSVVAETVERDLAGLECLSGIPGSVGATPIQNVGAYGQEVSDTILRVRVLDRLDLRELELSAADCGFGYRRSELKRRPDRFVVLSVTYRLERGARATFRYADLRERFEGRDPSLAEVRRVVLELRRGKSMVLDPRDPNRRSVGSFFVNPIVSVRKGNDLVNRALEREVVSDPSEVPRWPVAGEVKLSAAWLIERAGIRRGTRRGPVGVSSRHTLSLVHHGGGKTRNLLALAIEIRDRVRDTWGIELAPEPVFLGFEKPPLSS